jgi:transcription factor STE12
MFSARCLFTRCRHRRIHETQQEGQQQQPLSDEDLENEENEFGSLEDDPSPASSNSLVPTGVMNMASVTSMPTSMTMQTSMPTIVAPQMITPQYLQQQI